MGGRTCCLCEGPESKVRPTPPDAYPHLATSVHITLDLPSIAGISLEAPNLSFPLDLMQRVLRRGAYRSVGAQPQTTPFRIISGLYISPPVPAHMGWGSIWPPSGVRAPSCRVSLSVLRSGSCSLGAVAPGPQVTRTGMALPHSQGS